MSVITSLHLRIQPNQRFFENRRYDCDEADIRLFLEAAGILAERAYTLEDGVARVQLDWTPLVEWRRLEAEVNATIDPDADELPEEIPPVHAAVRFVDERVDARAYDLHSFMELFLHESFVMLNVAAPGSFGGRMRWSCGGLGDREVVLDARVFESAWVTAAARDWPRIEPLSLSSVRSWYDALEIGTRQVAMTSTARALFHLLYLARGEEEDTVSMLRLGLALQAVFDARESLLGPRIESILGSTDSLHEQLRRYFDDRDAMILGTAPVAHPMYDDALDPRADDPSFDYTKAVDFASSVIVGALQEQVRSLSRLRLVV